MTENERVQVRVEKVSKTYGDHNINALRGVSLNIKRGEFVALMGPSGCGKSTLLNLIGGIDRPSDGRITLDDVDLSSQTDEQMTAIRRDKIGFIFQFFNLLSTMTVLENVELPLAIGRKQSAEATDKAKRMLAEVSLSERLGFYPSQLSGGEMQRTAIARALIHTPELILADEPTGNLDSENGTAVLELLSKINEEKRPTIIMATHSLEAAQYAKRIVEIRDGIIIGDKDRCLQN